MERFFNFRWGKLQTFQNALRMFLNAFQRFEMRCAEKRLNANFVKPVFPKDGHKYGDDEEFSSCNDLEGLFKNVIFDYLRCFLTGHNPKCRQ